MTPQQLHILRHSLGLDDKGHGLRHRNHFVTGEGSTDHPDCVSLVEQGLMKRYAPSQLTGSGDLFAVTPMGDAEVERLREPEAKFTRSQRRYQAFLDADCGVSFREWLARASLDRS